MCDHCEPGGIALESRGDLCRVPDLTTEQQRFGKVRLDDVAEAEVRCPGERAGELKGGLVEAVETDLVRGGEDRGAGDEIDVSECLRDVEGLVIALPAACRVPQKSHHTAFGDQCGDQVVARVFLRDLPDDLTRLQRAGGVERHGGQCPGEHGVSEPVFGGTQIGVGAEHPDRQLHLPSCRSGFRAHDGDPDGRLRPAAFEGPGDRRTEVLVLTTCPDDVIHRPPPGEREDLIAPREVLEVAVPGGDCLPRVDEPGQCEEPDGLEQSEPETHRTRPGRRRRATSPPARRSDPRVSRPERRANRSHVREGEPALEDREDAATFPARSRPGGRRTTAPLPRGWPGAVGTVVNLRRAD